MSRSALFSSTIFSTCLVRDSSSPSSLAAMDRYYKKDKIENEFTSLGNAVCIMGKTGIGKTWLVHNKFVHYIELTPDILKSRQDTIEFLCKIKNSNLPVVLDEYECCHELIGIREIKEPPSSGIFIVTSQILVKFDFDIKIYEMPIKTSEEIKMLFPKAKKTIIDTCGGDLRVVSQSIEFDSDLRDDFKGPREFLNSLVSRKSNTNPANYIGYPIQEPGNIASILHENYPDSSGDHFKTIDSLSVADLIETRVYAGEWDLLQYFNFWGCIVPAVEIGHSLDNLRPGSTWTKYQNTCMRKKRIEALATRLPGKKLCHDELVFLRDFAEKEMVEILLDYKIRPQDIDVLNHLSPLRKIKPKTVNFLKKNLTSSE